MAESSYQSSASDTSGSVSPPPVIKWEFPVLAKYPFNLPQLKPLPRLVHLFATPGISEGTNPSQED
jgi:hypothetical protein